MQCLWTQRPEIPLSIGILAVRLGVALLGMHKIGELNRVANKKDRCIITYDVPVAFFGVEFNSKTSGIALGICRTLLTTDCREAE